MEITLNWTNNKLQNEAANDPLYRKSRSVYRILSISFIAVAIIPLVILSYALWSSAWDNAWREVEEKHKLLAINLISPLSIYVRDHQNSLNLVTHQISYAKKLGASEEVKELLEDSVSYLNDFQALAFFNLSGDIIYHTGKQHKRHSEDTKAVFQGVCFQQALHKRKSGLSGITKGLLSGKPTVMLCDPVLNRNDKIIGVLVGELDIKPIEKIRAQIQFGNKGHSAFVDQFGKVIAHPNPSWMEEMKDLSTWPIVKNMLLGKQGVLEFYSPFIGENMVAGYAGDPKTGWGVMVPQPKSEIENQVNDLMQTHLYWGIAGLSIALLFAVLLARWITQPINQLAKSAVALKISSFKGSISDADINSPREIQQLTHTIQDLTNGFKESQKVNHELNQSLESRIEQATKDLKLANAHLQRVASVDDLTSLANRRHIQQELESLHEISFSENKNYAVLLCDLDRFKLVNDNFGHHIGDRVLQIFAKKAPRELREGDMIGRWGGEEFLCIIKETTPEEAYNTAERIRAAINQTLTFDDNLKVEMSVSIGVATYPSCGPSLDLMLSNADAALYDAKRAGRNRVVSSSGQEQGVFTIAGLIHDSLANDRVHAAYQNIVDLQTEEVVAEETLARIIIDDEEIEAFRFIEAASQLQLTHKIDFELINHTITRMNKRRNSNQNILQFVNVSTDLLRNPALTHELVDRLEEWKAIHQQSEVPVVIEITEREFLGETNEALRLLKPFLDKGYLLAIDDFGSGYSSFQYLTDLPIAYLKIEGGLVRRAVNEPKVRSVLMAIQDTARDLNVITLAECIENKETYELLKELGINLGQGHYFGKPLIDVNGLNANKADIITLRNARFS